MTSAWRTHLCEEQGMVHEDAVHSILLRVEKPDVLTQHIDHHRSIPRIGILIVTVCASPKIRACKCITLWAETMPMTELTLERSCTCQQYLSRQSMMSSRFQSNKIATSAVSSWHLARVPKERTRILNRQCHHWKHDELQ